MGITDGDVRLWQAPLKQEENMADLDIELTLTGNIEARKVAIDHQTISFSGDGKGSIDVDGTMGDESNHSLIATIKGDVDASMAIKITCGGIEIKGPKTLKIPESTAPYATTDMVIKLKPKGAA